MRRAMRRAIRHGTTVSLLLAVVACSSNDAATTNTELVMSESGGSPTTIASPIDGSSTDPPDSTTTVPTTVTPSAEVTPQGYELVAATLTSSEGEVCDVCLWLADTAPQRSQGLMGVTDLGAGDGMAFVYPAPHTGSFWMRNTVLPLSIAFFSEEGDHLDQFDMEPCTADPCPLYPTPHDFTVAIEITQGDLAAIGIGPGSRLALSAVACVDGA